MKQKSPNELRVKYSAPEDNYEFFNSQNMAVNGSRNVWDNNWVRERHVHDTDQLIGVMDGSISERKRPDLDHKELSGQKPDVVIALDKSARPAIEMAEAFWDQFAQNEAEMPTVEYLNIDRLNWLIRMGYTRAEAESSAMKNIDFSKVTNEQLARIRAYFVDGDLSEEDWQEEVWQLPTRLDGKKLMILDEVQNSGATLDLAIGLIKRAIPEAAVVDGDVFWTDLSGKVIGGQTQRYTAPIWYDHDTPMGRGVGDVDKDYYDHLYEMEASQQNLRKKIASFVLSAPHHDHDFEPVRDAIHEKILQDIAYMTYDVADGSILRMPSASRGDDWDEIIAGQGLTTAEYIDYINRRKQENDKAVRLKTDTQSK